MNKMFVCALLVASGSATSFAKPVKADGQQTEISDSQLAIAKAEYAKCFSATVPNEQDDCDAFFAFKKGCGYTLPIVFDDDAMRIGLMYGASGSGSSLNWASTTYRMMVQMCVNMDGHEVYKPAFQRKIKKVVFDGTVKKAKNGRPSLKLDKGVLTFGVAPLSDAETAGLNEWGMSDPAETLTKFLQKAM
jgi:hypothetical protein